MNGDADGRETVSQLIQSRVHGSVCDLVLDSPDNRNALGTPLVDRLRDALARAAADDAVRTVVISSGGPVFSSGSDLNEPSPSLEPLISLFEAIADLAKPVVASVGGDVFGAAVGLVAACDIVVAADTARFALPEVRWGVAPTVAAVLCVPRLRPVDALEMMLTGEPRSAEWAQRAGLVTTVAPADSLARAVTDVTDAMSHAGPHALRRSKQLCRQIPTMTRADAFDLARAMSRDMLSGAEANEGLIAFRERRPPAWAERSDG